MSAVILGGLLAGVLLLVVAALLWQEAKRRGRPLERVYAVEEAVDFISPRLPEETRHRLGPDGVRRVIEWEVFYLQGLAQPKRHNPVETVAGGAPAAVDYIVERVAGVHGATYSPADVLEVLRLEAAYLESIGAVGKPVGGDES